MYEQSDGRKYSKSSTTVQTMHEIIFGKKAEKGGWKLLKYSRNSIEKINAIWITGISGRSKDKFDPDPDSDDFYYYSNDEFNYNIKIAKPTEKSIWLNGVFDNIPDNNKGEFYAVKFQ